MPEGSPHRLFLDIKNILFKGFEDQAYYHENLAATYSVTSQAWEPWFLVEQRHLPSTISQPSSSPSTLSYKVTGGARLSQGLCDAPDYQHALQWSAQQRRLAPDIPSAYLIWAPGMTVHTALSSLIFQILQQRPTALFQFNMTPQAFLRGRQSVTVLWDMLKFLMASLGGCLLYLLIGSVGEDEFSIVECFYNAVKNWKDAPPIYVTIIHPYHERFVGLKEATDLDGLYDVHPSLTTTDALHHVLMVELGIHQVSETIEQLLWDAVWRETRYASIGVCLGKVVDHITAVAEQLGREEFKGDKDTMSFWMAGVRSWLENPGAADGLREQVQRHLNIVDLNLPEKVKENLSRHVKRLALKVDSQERKMVASHNMTDPQRHHVWDTMREAMSPALEVMFCGAIQELVEQALEAYCLSPAQSQLQAGRVVHKILEAKFGLMSNWRKTMTQEGESVIEGIETAIMIGFELTVKALTEPRRESEGQIAPDDKR